ncbi:hypothetical protein [Actinoplanes derwentensis]|uniref:Uncharacterized protein n=1 Tax=Actinoplanes derwentensis TaxID=113562 RepID=A0A1H1Y5Z6_9ACTN|nr:hypothetical protein [Actinoplanes derwentensis]GID86708.1 hypothetical protein Ade03nite_56320 [Actinoplanes derwentensis]SDT16880.1 hypothetical protein SAMN04489716_2720 [Actinoplanes derwentensis]
MRSLRSKHLAALAVLTAAVPLAAIIGPTAAVAASSKFCDGGSYTVLGKTGTKDRFRGTVAAPAGRFTVQGKYTRFDIDPATFAIYDYAFTGAANVGDMTGRKPAAVYASKVPDHRGLALTSTISLELRDEGLTVSRTGANGLSMKIQAKDCAQGGIFQMEPSRGDGTRTRIVHTLADTTFYYDNPQFRARLGAWLGSACTSEQTGPASTFCVRVSPRVNIGSTVAPALVLRDSPQVGTRIPQASCGPDFTNPLGLTETKDQCGATSIWDVASGGRMGMVTGEDATEVANPPTTCTTDCQAENGVNGRLATLGFPAVVAPASRLTPRTSTEGLTAPLTAP